MKAGCTEGLLKKIIYRSGTLADTVEYAEFNCGKCTLLYCRVFFIFCGVFYLSSYLSVMGHFILHFE